MHTHLVIFISCDPTEIRSRAAFERCAEFTRYECTIELRCSDGRAMQFTCNPTGPTCWGWRFFCAEWEKRYGPI